MPHRESLPGQDVGSQYERADEKRRAYVAGKEHANYSDKPRQPRRTGAIRRLLRGWFKAGR